MKHPLSYKHDPESTNTLIKVKAERGVSDRYAIQTQLEQTHEAAYGWALSCCKGNSIEAEEVLQTTYLKVLDEKARYHGKSAFKTWLFSVIHKTAADQRRTAFLRRLRLAKHAMFAVHERKPIEPLDSIQQSQVLIRFREALQTLPKRQHEVLALVFAQDLTLQEASIVLGLTLGAVRKHYDRGKQKLRYLLKDLEHNDAI